MTFFGLLDTRAEGSDEHLPDHLPLIGKVDDYPVTVESAPLDLVCIPASRPFAVTREAVTIALDLAQTLGGRLLVLCSGEARADEFPRDLLAGRDVPVAVVSGCPRIPGLVLGTTEHPLGSNRWTVRRDVADKRNAALWVGVAAGWSNVVFIDDDVCRLAPEYRRGSSREFDVESLRRALAVMAGRTGPRAVGWVMTAFRDNSVVCHARRMGGLAQESFIGGGALAVRLSPSVPFFPPIYNEDWFFFYGLLHGGDRWGLPPLAVGGVVGQPYNRFSRVRAASEELPDALAEGLFAAAQRNRLPDVLTLDPRFWRDVMRHREEMVRNVRRAVLGVGVARRVRSLRTHRPQGASTLAGWLHAVWSGAVRRSEAWRALSEALSVHEDIHEEIPDPASQIVGYLRAWAADLQQWTETLRAAGPADARKLLAQALFVNCPDAGAFLGRSRRPVDPVGDPAGDPALGSASPVLEASSV